MAGTRNEVHVVDLQLRAVEMRRDRYSYAEIAEELGLAAQTVLAWINRYREETASEVRSLDREMVNDEIRELDYLRHVLSPDIKARDHSAIGLALKISESKRKLLGLDNPQKHEVQITIREFQGFDPLAAVRGELDPDRQAIEGELVKGKGALETWDQDPEPSAPVTEPSDQGQEPPDQGPSPENTVTGE